MKTDVPQNVGVAIVYSGRRGGIVITMVAVNGQIASRNVPTRMYAPMVEELLIIDFKDSTKNC